MPNLQIRISCIATVKKILKSQRVLENAPCHFYQNYAVQRKLNLITYYLLANIANRGGGEQT